MLKTWKDFIVLTAILMIVLFVVWGYVERSELHKRFSISSGVIYDRIVGGRGHGEGMDIQYRYEVGGKSYECRNVYTNISNSTFDEYLMNKRFNVAYDPKRPSISRMLITSEDFRTFNLPYPDSLRWLEVLLK